MKTHGEAKRKLRLIGNSDHPLKNKLETRKKDGNAQVSILNVYYKQKMTKKEGGND